MHGHHIDYIYGKSITICISCHRKIHTKRLNSIFLPSPSRKQYYEYLKFSPNFSVSVNTIINTNTMTPEEEFVMHDTAKKLKQKITQPIYSQSGEIVGYRYLKKWEIKEDKFMNEQGDKNENKSMHMLNIWNAYSIFRMYW